MFATAVILFTMLAGRRPFHSAQQTDPLYALLVTDPAKFWLAQAKEDGEIIFSDEFKDLFTKMVTFDPDMRPQISDVLSHPWMLGEYPTQHMVYEEMRNRKVFVNGSNRLVNL